MQAPGRFTKDGGVSVPRFVCCFLWGPCCCDMGGFKVAVLCPVFLRGTY